MDHRCEDYPSCGHGPAPWGDGGGCPDSEGRFNCILCGSKLDRGAVSSICMTCARNPKAMHPDDPETWEREEWIPDDDPDEDEEDLII